MAPTKLLYMEDMDALECTAHVAEVRNENGRDIVVLDQTVFYPQGGGQPYDKGVIESPHAKFRVEEVRFVDGVVLHMGQYENGAFASGEEVTCGVDNERRELHSRLHSGGHLVDMALRELNLKWIPAKGYHFPEGPYIEYKGELPEGVDKEKLKADIEAAANRIIGEGRETKILFMDKKDMGSVCDFVPEYIPEGKPARVVMYGDFGVPCGGTHVSNVSDIKNVTIRKIKQEGPMVRVAYDVSR